MTSQALKIRLRRKQMMIADIWRRYSFSFKIGLLFAIFIFVQGSVFGQGLGNFSFTGDQGIGHAPNPPSLIIQVLALVGISMLPILVMMLTSFVKMVITMSLLRNALGVQQSPPNQVLNGIAFLVTIYVMFPTGMQMYDVSKSVLDQQNMPKQLISQEAAGVTIEVMDKAKEPLRDFLIKNTDRKTLKVFHKLAVQSFPPEIASDLEPTDFIVLVPAFITGQIKEAFEIGVLIYLPFFVIDLVVSNILLAMGMMMLSPLTIALPLKLLLLVVLDGWTLLIKGLVLSFNH